MYLQKLKLSPEAKSVLSDILIEVGVVLLILIPGYVLIQDWFHLTTNIVSCIVLLRFAVLLRKK
jgi:hypothetical protein